MNKLNSLLKNLDKKYNINKGGCVFIAYCISKKFEKLGIDYTVCCDDKCWPAYLLNYTRTTCPISKRNKKCPHPFFCECSGPYHVFIKANGITYNRCKVKHYKEINISSKELLQLYNKYKWNEEYDVKNNDYIENIIINTNNF